MSTSHPNAVVVSLRQSTGGSGGFLYGLLLGPGGATTLAGICEVMLFHPFDTAAKRLMSHRHRIFDSNSISNSWRQYRQVIFLGIEKNKNSGALATAMERVSHMYPGSIHAVTYKVLQRFIKFAGQPYMREFLDSKFGGFFIREKQQKHSPVRKKNYGAMTLEATAGSLVGMCEVVLLPIDRMKVLKQTNRGAIGDDSLFTIIRREGIAKLYAGACTTMGRNALGSFLLFGGTACTKEYLFQLDDYGSATFFQNVMSSTVGSCIGVCCTSPFDLIKTRIQGKKFDEANVTGWRILQDTLRTEGVSAFSKGISVKLVTTAPRLVFSYTMTQFFIKRLRGE